ncbi:MAG: UDP-N-acetylmuramoyl-L-alanyl-D-glutamate--2,6-diaminopimelate ligase [Myxococcota bacterium]
MTDDTEGTMTLSALQRDVGGAVRSSVDPNVTGVRHDSRHVEPGDLFVAISGVTHDGARFVPEALARGAVAVASEQILDNAPTQWIVDDARLALSRAAEAVYGHPTRSLPTIGITGTNGKTTTAYLLARAISASSNNPALIGTTGFFIGDRDRAATHTTPEGDDISRFARQALADGATHLVLEVSSHGLALHRVDGVEFAVAAFTNLSRDHLDFHGTFEAYGRAKARLFTDLTPRVSVVHVDDPFGAALAEEIQGRVLRCSRKDTTADVYIERSSATRGGIEAIVRTPRGTRTLRSPMLGEHNLENLIVALGCVEALELAIEPVLEDWRVAPGSPGRLERVEHPGDVAVLVDYAHTPDALGRVLETLRRITPGRLIVVFGAGGDRDRGKRPEMGRVAARDSDLCVITSDNPRGEDPASIIDQVRAGAVGEGMPSIVAGDLEQAERGYTAIADRREAISRAIRAARDGDSVLLAGKGHEDYQIVGSERLHFDDREEARVAIASLGASG